jgi:protein translocase SecG subunit
VSVSTVLPYIQIILSVLLIASVLLQQTAASAGSAFGGGDSASFKTRRGFEKFIFISTFVLVGLFAASALVALLA